MLGSAGQEEFTKLAKNSPDQPSLHPLSEQSHGGEHALLDAQEKGAVEDTPLGFAREHILRDRA